ncbi:MAG: lipocalin family protein [Thermodesulfobacteriota bacterium]
MDRAFVLPMMRKCAELSAILLILVGFASAAGAQGETSAGSEDKTLVGTWELLYRMNEKGEQQLPHKTSRTFLEFTTKGEIAFTDIGRRGPGTEALKSGTYRIDGEEIVVTGDNGQVAKWPFVLADAVLRITLPDSRTGLYWHRVPAERLPPGRLHRHVDKSPVGTWELSRRINKEGDEELPKEEWITRLEFTAGGEIVFTRVQQRGGQGQAKIKEGKYTLSGDELRLTDEAENEVLWQYHVDGDTLTIEMTEVPAKIVWRRVKRVTGAE